jgi:hypothetical protein
MGRIKGRMQSDSAQLEGLMQQLPEESQAQVQEMTDSYAQFEGTIDQAAQDAGVQDTVDEAAQQARQSLTKPRAWARNPSIKPPTSAGPGTRRSSRRPGTGNGWRGY